MIKYRVHIVICFLTFLFKRIFCESILYYVVAGLFHLVANIVQKIEGKLGFNILASHECILIELNFQEVNELNINNSYWNMIQNSSLLNQTGKNKDNNQHKQ